MTHVFVCYCILWLVTDHSHLLDLHTVTCDWSCPLTRFVHYTLFKIAISIDLHFISGAGPEFQVRGGGAHLKKLRRAEGGAKIIGVFRVKNHNFTPKNLIFSNFRGGRAPGTPPPGSAPAFEWLNYKQYN